MADSASSLSWPCTTELANSMLKACVYDWAFNTCFNFGDDPVIERRLLRRFGHANFRKLRRGEAILLAGLDGLVGYPRWNCAGYCKATHGTRLFRVLRDEFQENFDVIEFKAVIKRWKECGIIQRYHPKFSSRFKSLVPGKPTDKPVSKLYRMGHGPKPIFWYWEINFKEGYYLDFLTADLAEGESICREERFDLWPTESWW
ncbi:hypothetical protein P691DRAFT_810045 [Macrolepiota fuliginosa MF-IS2]|uniref:Uncharacterized protein n=1 Tax=Macrolepiota fuliginosa MF-IS2 TaxID=1400762 RepID=A0A9P6BYT1_9AGAR|nr:hypothetical protein P691DRAFT_810045 [Macrolepiota fuliginosa MF-IS2]